MIEKSNSPFLSFQPVLSVCMTCYNQQLFIRQAVQSMLDQTTSIPFEIIIADDCSTDETWSILTEIWQANPDRILLLRQERNVGLAQNWADLMRYPRAGFVAYLEGDDYWTDPHKLEKQYLHLQSNPGHVLSFHDYLIIGEKGQPFEGQPFVPAARRDRTRAEMAAGCLIHQNTVMFRKVFRDLPAGFFEAPNHDTFFIAWLSNWGTAGYLSGVQPLMYRIRQMGLWGGRNRIRRRQDSIRTLEIIKKSVDAALHPLIEYRLLSKHMRLSWMCLRSGLLLSSVEQFLHGCFLMLSRPLLVSFVINRGKNFYN